MDSLGDHLPGLVVDVLLVYPELAVVVEQVPVVVAVPVAAQRLSAQLGCRLLVHLLFELLVTVKLHLAQVLK